MEEEQEKLRLLEELKGKENITLGGRKINLYANIGSVGDIGYVDEDGYLYFTDRRSGMIVTGGENVFAAEIETVLKKSKRVVEAVVVGLPDPEWGHRIHAFIEASEPIQEKTLIKYALNYLPPYKIPKSFEFVEEIPRNENGKIVRSKLVEQHLNNSSYLKGEKNGEKV